MTRPWAAAASWDVVVVGAGPAGSLAARELARRGRSVLLVDKARFPRSKVCGGCVARAGVDALERVGLGGLLTELGARPVRSARLMWRGRTLQVPLRGMVSVSRHAMDAGLVRAAEASGAVFAPGTRAAWTDHGDVTVEDQPVRARAVVVAAGLRAARDAAGAGVSRGSWIGLGASAPADAQAPGAGTLWMQVGSRGYVGCVVQEDGRANWAAAVDPAYVRACGSPGAAVRAICHQAGGRCPPAAGWKGTPALTRRVNAQTGPVYRVGDAAGYAEPITGEGMSWAMLGGIAVAQVVDRALSEGHDARTWPGVHRRLLGLRRARCLLAARALRSPALMAAVMPRARPEGPVRAALAACMIGGMR